jgi:hypothetical protein
MLTFATDAEEKRRSANQDWEKITKKDVTWADLDVTLTLPTNFESQRRSNSKNLELGSLLPFVKQNMVLA